VYYNENPFLFPFTGDVWDIRRLEELKNKMSIPAMLLVAR
jgi:hypothetical protein